MDWFHHRRGLGRHCSGLQLEEGGGGGVARLKKKKEREKSWVLVLGKRRKRELKDLFSKDEIGRGEFWVFVDEVDGRLVDESRLSLSCENSSLLLVETDVGVESCTE